MLKVDPLVMASDGLGCDASSVPELQCKRLLCQESRRPSESWDERHARFEERVPKQLFRIFFRKHLHHLGTSFATEKQRVHFMPVILSSLL
jgi:hypothetical protein